MSIHKNYLLLTDKERNIVDGIANTAFKHAKKFDMRLLGDDNAERAVEALATWFIASRSAKRGTRSNEMSINQREALKLAAKSFTEFTDEHGVRYQHMGDGWFWTRGSSTYGPFNSVLEATDNFADWASDNRWSSQ